MPNSYTKNPALVAKASAWLKDKGFPTWQNLIVDSKHHGFYEGISFDGKPHPLPRRSMVQARLIYSFRIARDLEFCSRKEIDAVLLQAVEKWVRCYRLPSGLFAHSADQMGKILDTKTDLYNQAFVLFGLAQAFSIFRDPKYLGLARDLVQELRTSRTAIGGGFLEVGDAQWTYRSNPHMHLFEGALAWMEVDNSEIWRQLADQILDLCAQKFVDVKSSALCETFAENWMKVRGPHGFVFEPGHHYEWSWLLAWYESLTGGGFPGLQQSLYELAERAGVKSGRVVDEVWSDLTVKVPHSRYWPQCERIKASLRLACASHGKQKEKYLKNADEAIEVLFTFLNTQVQGLCFDQWIDNSTDSNILPTGHFASQEPRASCFYHIVNCLHEYLTLRNKDIF